MNKAITLILGISIFKAITGTANKKDLSNLDPITSLINPYDILEEEDIKNILNKNFKKIKASRKDFERVCLLKAKKEKAYIYEDICYIDKKPIYKYFDNTIFLIQ